MESTFFTSMVWAVFAVLLQFYYFSAELVSSGSGLLPTTDIYSDTCFPVQYFIVWFSIVYYDCLLDYSGSFRLMTLVRSATCCCLCASLALDWIASYVVAWTILYCVITCASLSGGSPLEAYHTLIRADFGCASLRSSDYWKLTRASCSSCLHRSRPSWFRSFIVSSILLMLWCVSCFI